jgi:hypothetical protein
LSVTALADDRLMVLTVDMTREGKKIVPPTPLNPVYYVPVFLGYQERGLPAQHFQRAPVSEEAIHRLLIGALAKKGYLVASREFPPTLTIAFEWGTVSPVVAAGRVINMAEIRACILGRSSWDVPTYGGHTQEILSLNARHYLLISAFEYQRKATKDDVLLWRAHSTTDAWGNYLDEVITPLVATATPALGRETKPGASWADAPGRVIVGRPEVVKDESEASAKTK